LIPDPYLDFGDRYWQLLSHYVRTGSALKTSTTRTSAIVSEEIGAPDIHYITTETDYLLEKGSEEWMLTPVALDAAEVLDIGKSRRGLRILEIGCGSAVFAATMAHRDPDSVINLLDTADGLERARKTIASVGLERQTEWITVKEITDLTSVEALQDQTFDLIVLAGIIHRLSPVQCRSLFAQVQRLVKLNREIVVIDVFRGQEQGDRQLAIFELELGLRTFAGHLPDPADLKLMLQEVGFDNLQFAHLPAAPHYWGLLVATRFR
jgi:cyclopropane fatty-acyl-phospholipid synthase-like methyltransferase